MKQQSVKALIVGLIFLGQVVHADFKCKSESTETSIDFINEDPSSFSLSKDTPAVGIIKKSDGYSVYHGLVNNTTSRVGESTEYSLDGEDGEKIYMEIKHSLLPALKTPLCGRAGCELPGEKIEKFPKKKLFSSDQMKYYEDGVYHDFACTYQSY